MADLSHALTCRTKLTSHKLVRRWASPFVGAVPPGLRQKVLAKQHEQLKAYLPMLCLLMLAMAISITVAMFGPMPHWQQTLPGAAMGAVALHELLRMVGRRGMVPTAREALADVRRCLAIALVVGGANGIWGLLFYLQAGEQAALVPCFLLTLTALVSAACLHGAPRALIVLVVASVMPLALAMLLVGDAQARALAVMLMLSTAMALRLAGAKFREMVKMLAMQRALDRSAHTDALTGLANRRAFLGQLERRLHRGQPTMLALIDLDGFKQANDTHGHLAGDAVLAQVGERLRSLSLRSVQVARLGGDEFALVYDVAKGDALAMAEIEALRTSLCLPYPVNGAIVTIGASLGVVSTGRLSGIPSDPIALIQSADSRLYADKAARKRAKSAPKLRRVG
ncbi:sensor domain-containing diguanylate cyclase [Novosphingobium umbonatum]|uniref:diguanylate cyclase n=1 Tax=Novosphingobium umbonatum TaxID=1908524 RepID=A0A437N213_9SPHN|nr:diguanylate cyclase [Novosphingobium umbonatum]RVU03885.1 sensor domain-containing diguanylate cyclase [Novosphingobium umbonatum]